MTESKFSPLREYIDSLEKDFEKQKTELEASQKTWKDLRTENETLMKKCQELELEKKKLNQDLAELAELAELTTLMKKQESESQEQFLSLKKQIVEYQALQEKLKSEKDDLEKTVTKFQEQEQNKEIKARFKVVNLMHRYTEMEGTINTLRFLKTEHALQISNLQKKLRHYETCTGKNNELHDKVLTANNDLAKMVDQLKTDKLSLETINKLQTTIINEFTIGDLSKDEVINELATQNAQNESKIEQLESTLGSVKNEVNFLYTELDKMTARLQDLDQQLTTTMQNFFEKYQALKDLVQRHHRIKLDGTLDERFCFTKEFICLSRLIKVNPVQSLYSNA